jgi:sulfate permease, SulP family
LSTATDPNNHSSNSDGEFFFTSQSTSRRRLGTTSMDASGAMHRLRVSMVGHTGDSIDDDVDRISSFRFPTNKSSMNIPIAGNLAATFEEDDETTQNKDCASKLTNRYNCSKLIVRALGQIPAIALIGIFHLMIGVPFGVSYFPMQWASTTIATDETSSPSLDGELPEGEFPIPGKEAFGIRLFLFSTTVGQIIFTFFSGFPNPIGLQMVENIGFTKELAVVAISHQGYGIDALATLIVMFGLSSTLVGVVFYLLGRFKLGKIVYFFPMHVLIGLIGGIGILLCKTGVEVTIAGALSVPNLIHSWRLWIVVVGLDALLRVLEWVTSDSKGNSRFALLAPVFFCMITPLFYVALWIVRVSVPVAYEAGYFFPPMVHGEETGAWDGFGTPLDVWKVSLPENQCGISRGNELTQILQSAQVIDFSKVSWTAIADSLPTMLALILFSLIHVVRMVSKERCT